MGRTGQGCQHQGRGSIARDLSIVGFQAGWRALARWLADAKICSCHRYGFQAVELRMSLRRR